MDWKNSERGGTLLVNEWEITNDPSGRLSSSNEQSREVAYSKVRQRTRSSHRATPKRQM